MSAPGGSLFLASALYCSHTAKTYTKLKSLIIRPMEITKARSHSACYWPLKSNLGAAIKAEILLPYSSLFLCCWPGNTEHLKRLQSFPSTCMTNGTVSSKRATDHYLESVEAVSDQHFPGNSQQSCACSWRLMCKGFVRSVAELNCRVSLDFSFFSVDLGLCERGKESSQKDFIPLPSLWPGWCSWVRQLC